MQRMRGTDAQMIYNETLTGPFVTLKVMIYEPVQPGSPPDFEDIKAFIARGIADWSERGLAQRVVRVPFGLHHPMWVRDPNFDIANHLHHIALPSPGNQQKLCDFISYILSMPLDRNRPLWDSWVVEGLEGGRIAWFCKMHHVLADGMMSAEQIVRIHQGDNRVAPPDTAAKLKTIDALPGKLRILGSALIDLFGTITRELPQALRSYRAARFASRQQQPPADAIGPFMAPHTLINEARNSPYRVYRYEDFSLGAFKALSRRLGCTINDLVLTISSEALRRYLAEFDHLPDRPLVAVVPVGSRSRSDGKALLNVEIRNNNVSLAFVPLDLRVEEPTQRLGSIRAGSATALENIRRTEGARLDVFYDFLPGFLARLANRAMSWRQRHGKNPFANLAISNVPGPKHELFACDGRLRMVQLLSCGNITDLNALGITVWSYLDSLCFSCLFRKDAMPEPDRFTQHLREAFHELQRNAAKP